MRCAAPPAAARALIGLFVAAHDPSARKRDEQVADFPSKWTARSRWFNRLTTIVSCAACGRSSKRSCAPTPSRPRRGSPRVQDRQRDGARPAAARTVARNLGLFAAGRGHSPARRPRCPRRPSLVRPPRRFPHGDLRLDQGAGGEECGDRADRREGRLLSQAAPADDQPRRVAGGRNRSYRIFIRSLLSITDNLVNDKVVHPRPGGRSRRRRSLFRGRRGQGHRDVFRRRQRHRPVERDFWLGDASRAAGRTATITRRWGSPPGVRGFRPAPLPRNGHRRSVRRRDGRRVRRHVGRRVRQRHAAVEVDQAGRGVRSPSYLHRSRSRSGRELGRAQAHVRAAAIELGRL